MHLPGVMSLKEKRSVIKPMLSRIRKQFNVSAAEIDLQDKWQTTCISIATVTNSSTHAQQTINTVIKWIETNFPDNLIINQEIEVI